MIHYRYVIGFAVEFRIIRAHLVVYGKPAANLKKDDALEKYFFV